MDLNSTKEGINQIFTNLYYLVATPLPEQYRIFINLTFYTVLIFIFLIFVWKFYKFISKRDILKLNLAKYNWSEHPVWNKFSAAVLYLLEYIIILPFIVFFWFGILALFILLLSPSLELSQILLISAAIVAATRLSAYYNEELSEQLSSLFPFILLSIFLTEPEFFSLTGFLERLNDVPAFFEHILIYLIFIIGLEILMRFLFLVIDMFTGWTDEEG